MPLPESFPAFLATQRDDAVDRGPATITRDELGDGEVTVRVDWSSINYKDALATIPKGQVARISPLVPGVDLVGEVVAHEGRGATVDGVVALGGQEGGEALGNGHLKAAG